MKKKEKISFIEIVWIFIVGCLLGFVVETVFYLFKYHHYVNKQGLIFGPFKPIYGIGALLLTFTYYILKNRSNINIFLSGVVVGSLFEYLASLILEYVFKSYIWDYSKFAYNINGRVYLPYTIMWGILALVWVRLIYLPLKKIYDNYIKKKWFKIISIIMAIFIIIDILLTNLIMIRQGYRNKTNFIFNIIDKFYSEKQIKKKFPKFRPIE